MPPHSLLSAGARPAAALPYRGPVATRTARIAPFQVMELSKRAALLSRDGHPVIGLNIGEPDFTAPPPVLAALAAATRRGDTAYTPALGLPALREAIAGHYASAYDLAIDPARIVVTAGASAALQLATLALVEPASQVLLADPGYPCNSHFVLAAGGEPLRVTTLAENRFQLDSATLERVWTDPARQRGVLLASPANPTGTAIGFAELGRIIAMARARAAFVIADEIYLDLQYDIDPDGPARPSALHHGTDVIAIGSFSKFFSMTGWRLGWLVLPPALVPVVERLAQNLYICPSTLAQHGALACFHPESLAIYAERREAFRARRDWLIPALEAIGLPVPAKPQGAFYAWADCRGTGLTSTALADRLLAEQYVATVPGHDFGVAQPDAFLRLSYATALPRLQEAVARMARITQAG